MDFSREFFKSRAEGLGRSSVLIEQLESYSETLLKKNLPVIFSPQHLALMLGFNNYEALKSLLDNRQTYYLEFGIKKRKGGIRYIMAPTDEIKALQYWIKKYILEKVELPEYVTAYQSGKSIIDNATPHIGQDLIIKYDLRNYFDSITEPRVYGIFRIIGYSKAVSVDLAKACCVMPTKKHKDRLLKNSILTSLLGINDFSILPQGAPTSPAISNLAAFRIDARLEKYSKRNGYNYTRYADDLTFSGPIETKLKRSVIKRIILEEQFKLNERKGSYRLRSDRQIVTGLNVNEGVTIAKKFRRKIETHLHNCLNFGPYNHLQKSQQGNKINYREWLLGNIFFIISVHPKQGFKMKEKFDRINWL